MFCGVRQKRGLVLLPMDPPHEGQLRLRARTAAASGWALAHAAHRVLALWDKRRPGVPPARVRPLQEADGADLEPQPLQIVSLASMSLPGPR